MINEVYLLSLFSFFLPTIVTKCDVAFTISVGVGVFGGDTEHKKKIRENKERL